MPKHARDAYLISKCLRRVVNDDSFGQVSAENVKILDVIAVDADAMLSKKTMSTHSKTTIINRECTEQPILMQNINTYRQTNNDKEFGEGVALKWFTLNFVIFSYSFYDEYADCTLSVGR